MAQDPSAWISQNPQKAGESDAAYEARYNQSIASTASTASTPSAPSAKEAPMDRGKRLYEEGLKADEKTKARAAAFFTNIPLAEEAAGLVTGLLPGGMDRQQGRQWVTQQREQAKQVLSPTEYGVHSMAPSVVAALSGLGAPAGLSGLAGAASRVALPTALEAARGFGAAKSGAGESAPTLGERASAGYEAGKRAAGAGALVEGGLGGLRVAGKVIPAAYNSIGKPIVEAASKTALGAHIGRATSSILEKADEIARTPARYVSDTFAGTIAPALQRAEQMFPEVLGSGLSSKAKAAAAAIEPTDITKIRRLAKEEIGKTGAAAGSAPLGRLKKEAEDAALASSQNAPALQAAEAQAAAATGIEEKAKRLVGKAESTSKQMAQTTMNQLREEADRVTSALSTPAEKASALKEVTRKAQVDEGKILYKALEGVAPPATPPLKVFSLLKRSPELLEAIEDGASQKANRVFMERYKTHAGGPSAPVPQVNTKRIVVGSRTVTNPFTGVTTTEDVTMPELDMETFHNAKKALNDRINGFFAGAENGIDRNKGRLLKEQLDQAEKDFLSMHTPADQKKIADASVPWQKKAEVLEAIRDGQNIMDIGMGNPAKMLSNRKGGLQDFLDYALEKHKGNPDALAAFRVAGKEAYANTIKAMSDAGENSAMDIATRLVGSPAERARMKAVFGDDDMVNMLSQYLPAQAERTAGAFSAPFAKRNTERITKVAEAMKERGALTAEQKAVAPALANAKAAQQALESTAKDKKRLSQLPFQSALGYGGGGQDAEAIAKIAANRLSPASTARIPEAMGSIMLSKLEQMPRNEALATIKDWQGNNPAVRQYLSDNMDEIMRRLAPPPPSSSIRRVRSFLTGQQANK